MFFKQNNLKNILLLAFAGLVEANLSSTGSDQPAFPKTNYAALIVPGVIAGTGLILTAVLFACRSCKQAKVCCFKESIQVQDNSHINLIP